MGDVRVPAAALWGAQTQRAIENFPISGKRLAPSHIVALAQIKRAAAIANRELGVLSEAQSAAIVAAAEEVIAGRHDAEFPVDVFQTGSGTSSNMNMNEVIARIAARASGLPIHPNDHVNASQSSNDVFPSSIHIAAYQAVQDVLMPGLKRLADALEAKATELRGVVTAGRTHLMDATPITLGQEFSGHAAQMRHGIERVEVALPRLAELPLGGTAVGTGLNAPAGFAARTIELIAAATGLPLREARNHFEAQGAQDALVELSGALRTVAVSLVKIANDLRWMGSGPRAGLHEINLPDLQPGSSIMPGKVNPVLPEAAVQVAAQVIGNDTTIAFAGAQGNFDLLVMLPVMAANLLESITILGRVCALLAERCVAGITANTEVCQRYAASSSAIVTPLSKVIGYDAAARVAKYALTRGVTVREAAVALGLTGTGGSGAVLSEAELDRVLDVHRMVGE